MEEKITSVILDITIYTKDGSKYPMSLKPYLDLDFVPHIKRASITSIFKNPAFRIGKIVIPTSEITKIVENDRNPCTVVIKKRQEGAGWELVEIIGV